METRKHLEQVIYMRKIDLYIYYTKEMNVYWLFLCSKDNNSADVRLSWNVNPVYMSHNIAKARLMFIYNYFQLWLI